MMRHQPPLASVPSPASCADSSDENNSLHVATVLSTGEVSAVLGEEARVGQEDGFSLKIFE